METCTYFFSVIDNEWHHLLVFNKTKFNFNKAVFEYAICIGKEKSDTMAVFKNNKGNGMNDVCVWYNNKTNRVIIETAKHFYERNKKTNDLPCV